MEHVPRTGAALLLCNHISHFDPSYMGVRFPRYIHFMADKPLLEIPILGQAAGVGLRLSHRPDEDRHPVRSRPR